MQVRKSSRNIGVWSAVIAIVAGLGVCGVPPGLAEEGAGKHGAFFKGGFMNLNRDRGNPGFSRIRMACWEPAQSMAAMRGWYAGAGLDLMLSKDVWGAMDKTSVLGEIGLQFNRINSHRVNNAAGSIATCTLGGTCPTVDPQEVQLTMMTINVAPKIKFMEGSAFRPWIIPVESISM